MNDQDKAFLKEVRARLEAATSDKWLNAESGDHDGERTILYAENGQLFKIARVITWEGPMADAELIAHTPEDLRRLLTLLSEQEQENERLRADLIEGEDCELCEERISDDKGNPLTFIVCGRCWNTIAEGRRIEVESLTRQRDEALDQCTKLHEQVSKANGESIEAALVELRELFPEVAINHWIQIRYYFDFITVFWEIELGQDDKDKTFKGKFFSEAMTKVRKFAAQEKE